MTHTSNGVGVVGGNLLADEFGAGLELEPGDAGRPAAATHERPGHPDHNTQESAFPL